MSDLSLDDQQNLKYYLQLLCGREPFLVVDADNMTSELTGSISEIAKYLTAQIYKPDADCSDFAASRGLAAMIEKPEMLKEILKLPPQIIADIRYVFQIIGGRANDVLSQSDRLQDPSKPLLRHLWKRISSEWLALVCKP